MKSLRIIARTPASANSFTTCNGLLVSRSARVASGVTVTAGVNTGKTMNDVCELRAAIPELTD